MDEGEWLYRAVGQSVRDARKRAGLTQEALARAADLARTSITNIEMGNQQPTLYALWRMADAIGVSPCELLPPWPRATSDPTQAHLPDAVPAATRAALLRISSRPT